MGLEKEWRQNRAEKFWVDEEERKEKD